MESSSSSPGEAGSSCAVGSRFFEFPFEPAFFAEFAADAEGGLLVEEEEEEDEAGEGGGL
jgi:hypothetical protein